MMLCFFRFRFQSFDRARGRAWVQRPGDALTLGWSGAGPRGVSVREREREIDD
jgi:hypothetical protein